MMLGFVFGQLSGKTGIAFFAWDFNSVVVLQVGPGSKTGLQATS